MASHEFPRDGALSPLARLALCALAVSPFFSVYIHHYTAGSGLPTGFIQWDMPYYNANGRAVFERGNGFLYPNPYDPDPAAPAIYFHWFVWVLGFGITKLGFDPGTWFVTLGAVGGFLCAYLTLRLVDVLLPGQRFKAALYLLTMWGGGVFCLARLVVNAIEGRPLGDDLFAYDPFEGGFFLNWGRNLVLPTESWYHALVAASWLGVLTHRWALALGAAGALAATHPFTGLQLLLTLLAWAVITLPRREPRGVLRVSILLAILGVFAWYYGVYLESFPQHREIRRVWSLPWTLTALAIALGYGPVALLAAARVVADRWRPGWRVGFLAVCFGVSFLLANHQWFLRPRQPLHFTHGYVWMPLWLIGMPLAQRLLVAGWERLPRVAFTAVASSAFLVGVSDNALYVRKWWLDPRPGVYFTRDGWEMFGWIRAHDLHGVLVCRDKDLCYWSATYTSLRPFYGHEYNTPHYADRLGACLAFFDRGVCGDWLAQIDYILVGRGRAAGVLHTLAGCDARPWRVLHESGDIALLTWRTP